MPEDGFISEALDRFHRDPARSATLPGRLYYDPAVHAAEAVAIFARTWQFVGHVSDLAGPGDRLTCLIGRETLVLRRDETGALRGLRGLPPHLSESAALDATASAPVRVEQLCGFLYVNLDPEAAPLRQGLETFEKEFLSFGAAPEKLVRAYRKEIEIAANWKNVIENYAECYHCPISHPSLATAALDMASYRIAVHEAYHVHTSGNCGDQQGYRLATAGTPRVGDFGSWLIWPNVVFEYYPGGKLTVFHNRPLGPERTLQTIEWYLPQATPTAEESEIIDFVDLVRLEDLPLVESVQRGLRNRGYRRGRFVIDPAGSGMSEHAVHDFQCKVLTALGDAP